MADVKNLELTKDSLTNIILMLPLLNEKSKEAISYLMYGCYLGESITDDKRKNKTKAS